MQPDQLCGVDHRGLIHDVHGVRGVDVHRQLRVEFEGFGPGLFIVSVLCDVIERVDSLVDRVGRRLRFAGDHLGRLASRRRKNVVATDGAEILGQAFRDEGLAGAGVALEQENALVFSF